MKYLSLNLVDIASNPYPSNLHSIKITIRGTKNLFNIFFKVDDIEKMFSITVCPTSDFTWIVVDDIEEKYVSYPILKRVLYDHHHPLTKSYLEWVDGLLFSNKVKALYHDTYPTDHVIDISDTDDTDSLYSRSSKHSFVNDMCTNEFVVASFEHKIQSLEHTIQLKDKDLDILHREISIRDEKLKLLTLQIAMLSKSEWV